MVLLNPILGSPVGSWQAGGCESRTSLRPGWLCWSDVPFVARARAGNEVSAKAGLIEAFLLLRSRINKQSCHVLAGFLRFVFRKLLLGKTCCIGAEALITVAVLVFHVLP